MSVVNENTAVSKPGTVFRRTGGTTSTSSAATRPAVQRASASRTSSWLLTVRNIASASAAGGMTLGATPPLMSPIV
ncbi:hypothetical protein D3C83_171970 [compost metagenome]